MAVSERGEVIGSVSGGCVEGAVYEVAREVLVSGRARLQTYGVSDGDAFETGLSCGGMVDIFVQADKDLVELDEVIDAIRAGRPVAVASVVAGTDTPGRQLVVWPDRVAGRLDPPGLSRSVAQQAGGALSRGRTGMLLLGPEGEQRRQEVRVFVQCYIPPAKMIVFGAIDFASAVARIGKFLGYHVTVCDARPVFATRQRFPEADELVVAWPHRFLAGAEVDDRTVICVLTHDPKFDVPLLQVALDTPARYIGAMGSRRTHDDRLRRLRELGVGESALARLSSPIGLDLGARTPEETAVAIAAEIVATAWGGSGQRLTGIDLAIHH